MISRFFIDRPIFATVLSVLITLVGVISGCNLPIAQYPRITPPGVSVSIQYPGASAQVVADTVAAPIEQSVTGIPGMLYMSSQSGNDGSYTLAVTFDVAVDLNTALVMVQNRVTLALPLLPTPVQNQGITIRKKTPDILLIVSLFSPKRTRDDLYLSNFALININDELLRVEGVSDIRIFGQHDYSIRAWLDPQKLASRNITAVDVADAVRKQNLAAALGQIGQPPTSADQPLQIPVDTLGRLSTPEQFGDIIIKAAPATPFTAMQSLPTGTRPGFKTQIPPAPSTSIVRLKDVGEIEMGALNYNQVSTFDGNPAVGVAVFQLPGTNALDVANAVRDKMKELYTRFPDDITYKIGYDTTPFISESIGEVYNTLVDAILLVALVVLFFLQDWRAMILPMIDVPVSLIGTFAVMQMMGYSLNNISLFGLVLAIGIVVDDAIVVLENIERQMAKGFDARTATIKAMEEITGPIIAITLVLCAVFVPCTFITGITGRFFRQFAVTIAASTIISAINAVTMTPSRALLIFKSHPPQASTEGAAGADHGKHQLIREALPWWIFGFIGGYLTLRLTPVFARLLDLRLPLEDGETSLFSLQSALSFAPGFVVGLILGWFIIHPVNRVLGAFFRGFNRGFDHITTFYGWSLGKMLHLSLIVLLIYGILLGVTYWVFLEAPTGFVPQQDMGRLTVSVQLPDSSSLERTIAAVALVDKITRATPGVAHTQAINGVSFVQQANSPNFGSIFVVLAPFAERRAPRAEQQEAMKALKMRDLKDESIMKALRAQWKEKITGAQVTVFGASPIPGLSVAGGFKIQVEDKAGLGLKNLQEQTDRLVRDVKSLKVNGKPALNAISTQFRSSTPQYYMNIDRAKVAALGVSLDDVNQTLQIYLGSLYVNSFNEFGRHWQVTLQAAGNFRDQIGDISLLQVRNKAGQMVSLATLVTVTEITGPIFVLRYNLSTAAPVTGTLEPGISSGDVIKGVNQYSNDILPRTMRTEWTELMYLQIVEGNTTLIVFGLAVLAVFLALSALYESWKLPLAVILVVPLCILCSITGVLWSNTSVNIFVQIGLVVLVGLACKNAILIVEFAKELRQRGMSLAEATVESSRLRLRPILMTSFAFILGVFPLVVAAGAGAEMRRSLGVAVFSGMLGVTFFGVVLTPVFFYVIQGLGETRLLTAVSVQWTVSILIGGSLGIGGGYLLEELGVFHPPWAMLVGGAAGVLTVITVMGFNWIRK